MDGEEVSPITQGLFPVGRRGIHRIDCKAGIYLVNNAAIRKLAAVMEQDGNGRNTQHG